MKKIKNLMKTVLTLVLPVVISVACATASTQTRTDPDQWRAFAKKELAGSGTRLESVESINLNQLYTVYPSHPAQAGTYTTLYVGKRKAGITKEAFVSGMHEHIRDVSATFRAYGLIDYRFVLASDYEFAIQTWSSKAASEKAFASEGAKPIFAAGGKILDNALFEELK